MQRLLNEAYLVSTSRITYAETRAAFVRAKQNGLISDNEYTQITRNFIADWEACFTLDITEPIIYLAGDLTERYMIRGFDAIHLASGLILSRKVNDAISFACWDARLWKAAKKEGFEVAPDKI